MEVQNRFRVIMIIGIFYLICIVHTSGTVIPQQCRIKSEVPHDRVHLKLNSGIGILKRARTGGWSEDKTESVIVGTGTLTIVGVAIGICCYYSRRWLCHCFYPNSVPVMRRSPLVSNPYGQGHHVVYHTFPSCTNKATVTRPASTSTAYKNGVGTGAVDGYTALNLESYKNEKMNEWAAKQNDMKVFPPDSDVASTSASLAKENDPDHYEISYEE